MAERRKKGTVILSGGLQDVTKKIGGHLGKARV